MATEMTYERPTQAELLYRFLGQQLQNGGRAKSLDELLAAFRDYERETLEIVAALESGMAEFDAGNTLTLAEHAASMRKKHPTLFPTQ